MKLRRQYSAAEVGKLLKHSEGQGVDAGPGAGHAEGLHELQSVGRGRQSTTDQDLLNRAEREMKETVGAFDGCQVQAVTFALNSDAGQNALGYLEPDDTAHIFAVIDVQNQHFRMREAQADVFVAPMFGTPMAAAPLGVADKLVLAVAMKLMKDERSGQLHIRTAYPLSAMPGGGQSRCSVTYANGSQPQNLPI